MRRRRRLAAMMQDVGAHIKPDEMEQLKNEYLKDFGELWQDFVAGKTPVIKDRRFSSAPGRAIPCRPSMPRPTC
jgi:polyhydroxyalkanoate synthase